MSKKSIFDYTMDEFVDWAAAYALKGLLRGEFTQTINTIIITAINWEKHPKKGKR